MIRPTSRPVPLVRGLRVLLLPLALACSPTPGPPTDDASDITQLGPPFIEGVVTAVEPGRVRVEEQPADASGTAKAMLSLTEHTVLARSSGAAVGTSDLRVGARVRAWITGPVMESYPVQATASALVIDDGES